MGQACLMDACGKACEIACEADMFGAIHECVAELVESSGQFGMKADEVGVSYDAGCALLDVGYRSGGVYACGDEVFRVYECPKSLGAAKAGVDKTVWPVGYGVAFDVELQMAVGADHSDMVASGVYLPAIVEVGGDIGEIWPEIFVLG